MSKYTLNINGEPRTVDVPPDTPLLWVLRDTLNLVGTKFGCGISQCGACTVLVNHRPVRTCGVPVKSVAGKDVITEKPMTIDAEKIRAILKAEKKSGRKVTVTFNYRFTPPMTLLRQIVAAGTIGDIVTVDMHWPLDLRHGAVRIRHPGYL